MKQNNLGWFIFVLCVVFWALYEIYPPTSRSLVQEFSRRAVHRDAAFTNILAEAASLQQDGVNRSEFATLETATGTNELQKYFPFYSGAANTVRPNLYILNHLQKDASGKIKLGIDLQGGTSFLVEMDTNVLFSTGTNGVQQPQSSVTSAALDQAISVLRARIDRFGVAEPVIQSAGGNQILIELPGLSQADKDSAREQITKKAYLEFRLVSDHSAEMVNEGTGEILAPIPPGFEVLKKVEPLPGGKSSIQAVVVSKKPVDDLVGDIIKYAAVSYDNLGPPKIEFELTPDAGLRFGEVTRNNIGHRMAIVLDGELVTAPNINSAIETGSGEITGSYSMDEARAVANAMQNPLRAPLSIIYATDTLRDLVLKGHKPSSIRFLLASVPYRHQLNFTVDGLKQAAVSVERLRNFRQRLLSGQFPATSDPAVANLAKETSERMQAGMDDDLNTALAQAAIFDMVRKANVAMDAGGMGKNDAVSLLAVLEQFDGLLAVLKDDDAPKIKHIVEWAQAEGRGDEISKELLAGISSQQLSDTDVQTKIAGIEAARRSRDFKASDAIRAELAGAGIAVEITKEGVRWKRK